MSIATAMNFLEVLLHDNWKVVSGTSVLGTNLNRLLTRRPFNDRQLTWLVEKHVHRGGQASVETTAVLGTSGKPTHQGTELRVSG